MIRFYQGKCDLLNNAEIIMELESFSIEGGGIVWDDIKEYFKRHIINNPASVSVLPLVNGKGETFCYAYQDMEANCELRMLKELEKNCNALQFCDIFPEIEEVAICGCNELAYCFVQYLEKQGIAVKVFGRYWDMFGYQSDGSMDWGGVHRMVIHAEDILSEPRDFFREVTKSVSPAFECIDIIYETNVLDRRIHDTEGTLEGLLGKLKGKEIVILGTDVKAQDTYDFLYGNGIDICGFAEWTDTEKRKAHRTLLGKSIVSIRETVNDRQDVIFIDGGSKNSALGMGSMEILDYYGYERDERLFLIRDYTEVPCGNLLHVLKGKKVYFAGDEKLCAMLIDYLSEREAGDIELVYVEASECSRIKETDILCVLYPWDSWSDMESNPKRWRFRETLSRQETISYTDYFSQTQVLVSIDLYRNRGRQKYTIENLCPQGILLGRIPAYSGNYFFRGILDGHPNILEWTNSALNNNLFLYCIRLAGEKSGNILDSFQNMLQEELTFRLGEEIPCWERFESSANALLSLKETFTSQELFVILHIAYMEMLYGCQITDVNQKIIYWEPHQQSREDFPFYAQWLEDEKLRGQTVFLHRDMLVRAGSTYNFAYRSSIYPYENSIRPGVVTDEIKLDNDTCQYWEEFHARFEDIKLHPRRELQGLCDRMGIPWSDTMLRVTKNGETWECKGISDFDLKPVFNKYEEFLSEFDRFRIAIINAPFQKTYGYTYEDCMKYSRRELQEWFLKKFRFQEKLRFKDKKDKMMYFLRSCRVLMDQLWNVRKYMLLHDITPVFGEIEIGESASKRREKEMDGRRGMDAILALVRQEKKLVLYGVGRDCKALWEHLDERERERLVLSDLKAEYQAVTFHGREVVAPSTLCGVYREYKILVTSSLYYKSIQKRLEEMGVAKERIICNTFQLWEEKE